MPKVTTEREMDVPAEVLRRVILDFEKYPLFMPEVVSAKPQGTGLPEYPVIDFVIEVMKRFAYTLEFDLSVDNVVRWRLVQSDLFTCNEGAWTLSPISKERTRVQYELDVGVKFLIPKWVAGKLTEVGLPKLLTQVENRAKELMNVDGGR